VFGGLRQMGVKRSTPYNDAAIAKRHKALAEAGWTTVNMDPSKGDELVITRPEDVPPATKKRTESKPG